MPRRNLILPLAALVVLVLFCFLLIRILLLRYERGDVYPAYSTLRSDPLGTRAFYEALAATGKFQVERGFLSLRRELAGKPGTVFYIGLPSEDLGSFTDTEVAALDGYVRDGGRVVITLQPEKPANESSPPKKKKAGEHPAAKPGTKKDAKPVKPPEDSADQAPPGPQTQEEKYEREQFRKEKENESDDEKRELSGKYQRSLAALWGFGWTRHRPFEDASKEPRHAASAEDGDASDPSNVMALRATSAGPEYKVPWKSALYFVRLEPEWKVRYDAKGKPVLIRRSWGKGEILLATDSYFLSNEALRNDRRPALLSFVAGGRGNLLFDETHLGTQEQEGVMTLARRFRLEGYLYGMLGVAALFLWRNSVPLVPPREGRSGSVLGGTVSGKDSRSGLINLLRRNIPAAELLKVCLTEWKRGIPPGRKNLDPKVARMEEVLAGGETAEPELIVHAYRHLREINAPSRAKGSYATKS